MQQTNSCLGLCIHHYFTRSFPFFWFLFLGGNKQTSVVLQDESCCSKCLGSLVHYNFVLCCWRKKVLAPFSRKTEQTQTFVLLFLKPIKIVSSGNSLDTFLGKQILAQSYKGNVHSKHETQTRPEAFQMQWLNSVQPLPKLWCPHIFQHLMSSVVLFDASGLISCNYLSFLPLLAGLFVFSRQEEDLPAAGLQPQRPHVDLQQYSQSDQGKRSRKSSVVESTVVFVFSVKGLFSTLLVEMDKCNVFIFPSVQLQHHCGI